MSGREVYAVNGVAASRRRTAWSPGICLSVCNTKEEAERAVEQIRWRGKSRPTRIVRRLADPPYTEFEEWRL